MILAIRIHRGFHRVGVVLAVFGLLSSAFVAVQGETTEAVGWIAIAVVFYIVARTVGWVLAGFIGSDG